MEIITKIIYIDDIFHPDAGYQVNLLSKYWVKYGHQVYIFTSEMNKIPSEYTKFFNVDNLGQKDRDFESRTGVIVRRFPLLAYKSGRSIYKRIIFKQIEDLHPDVVFVNGNDTIIGMQLIRRYKNLSCGLVTDSHMLEMASENRFRTLFRMYYRRFITPKILKNNIPVIRAQDDKYVDRCLGIPIERCPWISFGSDTDIFHPDEKERHRFRNEHGIKDDSFLIVYAGKISESKGASILVKAMQTRLDTDREVVFLLVGTTDGDYGKKIDEEIKRSNYRVIRYPTQKYYELPRYYQSADIAVYPKQCSLSFYDVQACGLPVVFEDNNINIDRAKYRNALTYETNNIGSFCDKLSYFANMPTEVFKTYSRNAEEFVHKSYDYKEKAKEYIPHLEKQAQIKKGRIEI